MKSEERIVEMNAAERAFDDARRTRADEVKIAMAALDIVGCGCVDILRMAGFNRAEYRVVSTKGNGSIRIWVCPVPESGMRRWLRKLFRGGRDFRFESKLDLSGEVSEVICSDFVCQPQPPQLAVVEFARAVSRLPRS